MDRELSWSNASSMDGAAVPFVTAGPPTPFVLALLNEVSQAVVWANIWFCGLAVLATGAGELHGSLGAGYEQNGFSFLLHNIIILTM